MSDPTIAAWSRENDLLFQLRQLREENERLREDKQSIDAVATLTEDGWLWDGDQWQRPPAAQPCPTCVSLARAVMLDQTSHDATPSDRQPLTDKQILADETLRYYFGQNGGAGPVSKQGRKVVNAIEALHGIKEVKSCGS